MNHLMRLLVSGIWRIVLETETTRFSWQCWRKINFHSFSKTHLIYGFVLNQHKKLCKVRPPFEACWTAEQDQVCWQVSGHLCQQRIGCRSWHAPRRVYQHIWVVHTEITFFLQPSGSAKPLCEAAHAKVAEHQSTQCPEYRANFCIIKKIVIVYYN